MPDIKRTLAQFKNLSQFSKFWQTKWENGWDKDILPPSKSFGEKKSINKLHNLTDHQSCHHLLHLHWRVAPQTSQWKRETGQNGSGHPHLHSGWTCLFSPSEKLIWNQCFIHHKPSIIHLYSCRYWYLYILLFIAYLYYSVQKPIAEV